MGKLFGTDGIRGIAGQTLTAELAFHVGQAVAAVLTEEKGSRPLITIGKDTRISSDMLEAALMAGICSVGGDVMPLGTIPTPAVAFLTVQQQADAGIVISASHNPYAYNGIKVFNAQGYKLSDEMEQRVEDLILNHAELPASVDGAVGRRHHGMHALHSAYVQHLLGSIDCDLTGLRVLVDCANGAASATAPDLFRALPLQADFIHTEPDGVNINNGCGSTHLESLARGVVSGGYDLGIAFDGDADRCLLVDEQGNTIDGELTALQFLQTLRRSGVPASQLAARCPQYPQELINVEVPHTPGVKERIMADEGLRQETRRWEEKLGGQGRILIRPSGTEALIRVMVEAKTTEIAHQVASVLADFIKKL